MNAIDLCNKSVNKKAVNIYGENYEAVVGQVEFTPELVIDESKDYNCGAFCNELEYARLVATSYTESISIDGAENGELDLLVDSFVKLERLILYENDDDYRNRFKALVVQNNIPAWTTRTAIMNALGYFLPIENIFIWEPFDTHDYYFEVRLKGLEVFDADTAFVDQNYFDNCFIGGAGVGKAKIFADDILPRIRAAGIQHNVVIVDNSSETIFSDAFLLSTRIPILSDANILCISTDTILSDAVVIALGTDTITSDATIT